MEKTAKPLSIGNPDGTHRQSPKNTFRNFLIDQSSPIETQPPFQARWIIDTMVNMRSVKLKKTYNKWFTILRKIFTPNKQWKLEINEFVCNTQSSISIKRCTHKERAESGKRVYFHGEHQKKMSAKD